MWFKLDTTDDIDPADMAGLARHASRVLGRRQPPDRDRTPCHDRSPLTTGPRWTQAKGQSEHSTLRLVTPTRALGLSGGFSLGRNRRRAHRGRLGPLRA